MTTKKVKVKFLRDHVCQNIKQSSFKEGQEYDLREDAAAHFAKRGLIEIAADKASK